MPISQKSLHVMLHLFLVYISWGSTYIGYKFSLGVAGPFLVGGSRMVIGGHPKYKESDGIVPIP